MTPTEADQLAKRIINCWHGGPPITEWREELTPLDHGQAGTALARLKRTSEHAPTIARFLTEYRALSMVDGGSYTKSPCSACSDTGWLEAELLVQRDKAGEIIRTYTQVDRCRCQRKATR